MMIIVIVIIHTDWSHWTRGMYLLLCLLDVAWYNSKGIMCVDLFCVLSLFMSKKQDVQVQKIARYFFIKGKRS